MGSGVDVGGTGVGGVKAPVQAAKTDAVAPKPVILRKSRLEKTLVLRILLPPQSLGNILLVNQTFNIIKEKSHLLCKAYYRTK